MKPDTTTRLKVGEAAAASLIVIGAAAAIAIGFTALTILTVGAGLNPFKRRR